MKRLVQEKIGRAVASLILSEQAREAISHLFGARQALAVHHAVREDAVYQLKSRFQIDVQRLKSDVGNDSLFQSITGAYWRPILQRAYIRDVIRETVERSGGVWVVEVHESKLEDFVQHMDSFRRREMGLDTLAYDLDSVLRAVQHLDSSLQSIVELLHSVADKVDFGFGNMATALEGLADFVDQSSSNAGVSERIKVVRRLLDQGVVSAAKAIVEHELEKEARNLSDDSGTYLSQLYAQAIAVELKTGDAEAADRLLRKALGDHRADKQDLRLNRTIAMAYAQMGDWKEAEKYAWRAVEGSTSITDAAIASNPLIFSVFFGNEESLAGVESSMHQLLQRFEHLLEEAPAATALATIYLHVGKSESCAELLERFAVLEPASFPTCVINWTYSIALIHAAVVGNGQPNAPSRQSQEAVRTALLYLSANVTHLQSTDAYDFLTRHRRMECYAMCLSAAWKEALERFVDYLYLLLSTELRSTERDPQKVLEYSSLLQLASDSREQGLPEKDPVQSAPKEPSSTVWNVEGGNGHELTALRRMLARQVPPIAFVEDLLPKGAS